MTFELGLKELRYMNFLFGIIKSTYIFWGNCNIVTYRGLETGENNNDLYWVIMWSPYQAITTWLIAITYITLVPLMRYLTILQKSEVLTHLKELNWSSESSQSKKKWFATFLPPPPHRSYKELCHYSQPHWNLKLLVNRVSLTAIIQQWSFSHIIVSQRGHWGWR